MTQIFKSRIEAGRALAAKLEPWRTRNPAVVGLTRGGVPVAAEVAAGLGAPLDALVVRKLGAPGFPEVAVGAVAEGGETWLEPGAERVAGKDWILTEIRRQEAELRKRCATLRAEFDALPVAGRVVILVDDGAATGATASAAARAMRRRGAAGVVVAAPVASAEAKRALSRLADAAVFLIVPEEFDAVGRWYRDFSPVADADVLACLREARRRPVRP